MIKKYCLLLIILSCLPAIGHAQQKYFGHVYDAKTRQPVPFATIKFGDSGTGVIADLDGVFEIPGLFAARKGAWIEVTSLGYAPQKITISQSQSAIYLEPEGASLNEMVVTPPYDKIRRILNAAIANKNRNNPDRYEWYRCHVYYKMVADIALPDSIKSDTSKTKKKIKDFIDSQHLLMSETYSIRTWRRPQQLQEDVLASKFSGLKKSPFTSLITDVQPFHAYSDYLTLNEKDYHNPVSKGYERYYKFNLTDELLQGKDTIWVLSFTPRGHKSNDLKGTVYINSDGYAISYIIAKARDTMLKLDVRIEQQYIRVAVNESETRWFPKELNYIIDWEQRSKKAVATLHMKGNSLVDSVTWHEDKQFHFDKVHTVRMGPDADEATDALWKSLRPIALDAKEQRTYQVIDSLGEKTKMDKAMGYFSKLPDWKIPIGIVDFDLKRIYAYNQYENTRLGLGAQTNEHLIKWLSVGGWAGYGLGDEKWKYGVFGEVYGDRYHEFVFRAGYTDDINDPGRIHLNHDIDKNYLNYYLLQRVDETKTTYASVKKRLGYWSVELAARQQEIQPMYQYALTYNGATYSSFQAREASVNLRYAFAERTSPFYGKYLTEGSKYPIWYGQLTIGEIESGPYNADYTQAIAAVVWHKHINRIGFEHLLVEGAQSWSNNPLPLSKIFAGNGYKFDGNSFLNEPPIYSFGGMETITPYEFYTDRFVNMIYRHDFDWKLYKFEIPGTPLSSVPNICLQYGLLYGTLDNRQDQKYALFSVPDNGYSEAGVLLNHILRLKYLNIYYITLNVGYFYHIADGGFNSNNNGRFVIGASGEL